MKDNNNHYDYNNINLMMPDGPFSFNISPNIDEKVLSQHSVSEHNFEFYSNVYTLGDHLKLVPPQLEYDNELIGLTSIELHESEDYNFELGRNLPVFIFYSTKGSLIFKNLNFTKNFKFEKKILNLLEKFSEFSENDSSMQRSRSFGSQLVLYNLNDENYDKKSYSNNFIFTRYDPQDFGRFMFLAYHSTHHESLGSFFTDFISFYLAECIYHKIDEDESLAPYDWLMEKSEIEEEIWLNLKKVYFKFCKKNLYEKKVCKKFFEKNQKISLTTENAIKYLKKINCE